MPKKSAGLLMFRRTSPTTIEVLLAHPGGPLWAGRDHGAWTIPKGEYLESEDPLEAAQREFAEETGFTPKGPFIELGTIRQKSGKLVTAWAFEGDCDPSRLRSNTFPLEWPKGSGAFKDFPEVDRARWFSAPEARERINPAQAALLAALDEQLHAR